MLRWVHVALPTLAAEQVCVDGKTLRGSGEGAAAVHLVSAYAARTRLVLTQQAVAEKANEIVAIPDLLALLELKRAVVTIDAMDCQKAIAQQLVEAGADYVLALKDNHPSLCQDVSLWLDTEAAKGALPVWETVEKDHGRLETRCYHLSSDLDWLAQKPDWAGLSAVGRVQSQRIIGDKTTTECRYYICSFAHLERFAEVVRGHWAIENSQHWVLDVQFNEDANRVRKEHSAKNLGLVRRMSLNVLRHNDPSSKLSLRRRKRLSALNDDYRFRLFFAETGT